MKLITKLSKLVAAVLLAAACLNTAHADTTGKVTLAWDASTDVRVNEYKVYYGTTPTTLNQSVVITVVPPATAPATTVTVTGLTNGATYYFAATAVDTVDALESIFSAVVNTQVPFVPLPQITNLKVVSAVAK
jgi:hypothetical protein